MSNEVEVEAARRSGRGRRVRGALIVFMGCLAIAEPFFAGSFALFLVGILLCTCGVLEMLETFRLADEDKRATAYFSGILSIVAGILLLSEPRLVLRGLALVVAGSFLIDGCNKLVAAWRGWAVDHPWKRLLAGGVVNVVLALVLVTRWPVSGLPIVVILVGVRMLSAGWAMLLGREEEAGPAPAAPLTGRHPDGRLGLPAHQEFSKLHASFAAEEVGRRRIDAAWCWTFVFVFFAIHLGRMEVEWNLVGMVSPLVAVLGDVATALFLAFAILLPCRLAWRNLTRPVERRGWTSTLASIDGGRGPGLFGRMSRGWLVRRMRISRRLAQMRTSPRAALRWGLQVGLPVTAILVAVNPIWGFSWFFNSESWATEVWDRWAAARTDKWREQMVIAVESHYRETGPDGRHFRVTPEGAVGSGDFSFLLLGDTGEGGAAQQSLRDQYLFLGQRPDVKFLVISSDVIYPSGAMSGYERNFYLPFKGFTKPIYAIPGNHDWYDALEGFAANFLEADAARATMHARVAIDNRLTTTTNSRIEAMIEEAARLRRAYGVQTGWQRGPFFEVQGERFALIAADTGVLRRVDTIQWHWLKAALDRARDKFTMVILGHPLYAGGRYQGGHEGPTSGEGMAQDGQIEILGHRIGAADTDFGSIHELLRDHQVPVIMAGDTHYFEHYQERYEVDGASRTMHHFVNGGGGAYMSIGTPLDWPKEPAVADCAFFPRRDFVIDKLDRETPAWKWPLWQWAKRLRGWPLTAESLSAAFVYNRAPFMQSFVEVRVEPSKDRVRIIPWGAAGRIRWREFETFGAVMPNANTGEDEVEFIFPIPGRR